jgi:hypothetical protein
MAMKKESGSKKPMSMVVKAKPMQNSDKSRKPKTPGSSKSMVLDNTKPKSAAKPAVIDSKKPKSMLEPRAKINTKKKFK